jgi:hypothetical protein
MHSSIELLSESMNEWQTMPYSLPIPIGSCQAYELDGHIVVLGPPWTIKAKQSAVVAQANDDNDDDSTAPSVPPTSPSLDAATSSSSSGAATGDGTIGKAIPKIRRGGGRPIWVLNPRETSPTWHALPSIDDDAIGYSFTVA